MRHTKNNQEGFTVMELLIYSAILALTLAIVVVGVAGVFKIYGSVRASQELARSGSATLERIVRDVRSAEGIDFVETVAGSSAGVLSLLPSAGEPARVFYIQDGAVVIEEDGVVAGKLTGARVFVSALTFSTIQTVESEGVRTVLTLEASTGRSTTTKTFSTTAVIRGSYGN